MLLFLDRPDDAVDALERSLTLGEPPETDTIHSGAILALTWARTMRGELDRGRELAELGLRSPAVRRHRCPGTALSEPGPRPVLRRRVERAREHLERGVALARSSGPTLFSGIPPAYLGLLHRGEGDLDAAAACYLEAATAPDLQTFAFDAYVDARLAELDVLRDEPAAALARLEHWVAREIPCRLHDVMLLSTAAEACLQLGDLERAHGLAERAEQRAVTTRNEVDGVDATRVEVGSSPPWVITQPPGRHWTRRWRVHWRSPTPLPRSASERHWSNSVSSRWSGFVSTLGTAPPR